MNVRNNQEVYVPADVLILGAQCICHKNLNGKTCGRCFISTTNINGDASVQNKQAHPALARKILPKDLNYKGTFSFNDPTPELHDFKGYFSGTLEPSSNVEELKFTSLHFVPRGSVLFHADSVTCLVVYVGEETKIGNMVSSPDTIKARTISDKAIDKLVIVMVYLIISLTVVISIVIAAERSTSLRDFENIVVETEGYNFFEILEMTFLQLEFCVPVNLLFIIELLRLWLARNTSYSLIGKRNVHSCFVNPSHIDDLGKVTDIIFDGMEFLTKRDLEVKSISTLQGKYKNDALNLRRKIEDNKIEGKALSELAEAIILTTLSVQSNFTECDHKNTENKALIEFSNSLGTFVNKIDAQTFKMGENEYEYVDSFSVPVKNDLLSGIIIKTKTKTNNAKITYVLKGYKEQMAEYLQAPIVDFTPRGLKTIYFAVGYLDSRASIRLEDATTNEFLRQSVYERGISLFHETPKSLKTIGSVGIRNKANKECSLLFDQFKSAGIKVIIASQNPMGAVKGYCIESGVLKQDNFQIIDEQSILADIQSGIRNPVNLLIDGRLLNDEVNLNTVAKLLNEFNEKCVFSNMTSGLKKSLVQKLQSNGYTQNIFQRTLQVLYPFKLQNQAVMAVGSSAHDVEMMRNADFSVYLDTESADFTFKDANIFANFSAESIPDLKQLLLVHGIQNSFSVSKVIQILINKFLKHFFPKLFSLIY